MLIAMYKRITDILHYYEMGANFSEEKSQDLTYISKALMQH